MFHCNSTNQNFILLVSLLAWQFDVCLLKQSEKQMYIGILFQCFLLLFKDIIAILLQLTAELGFYIKFSVVLFFDTRFVSKVTHRKDKGSD